MVTLLLCMDCAKETQCTVSNKLKYHHRHDIGLMFKMRVACLLHTKLIAPQYISTAHHWAPHQSSPWEARTCQTGIANLANGGGKLVIIITVTVQQLQSTYGSKFIHLYQNSDSKPISHTCFQLHTQGEVVHVTVHFSDPQHLHLPLPMQLHVRYV